MKQLVAIGLIAISSTALAQPVASLPTTVAAAKAYVAYEENICRALIDVCEGIPHPDPTGVRKLSCHPVASNAAQCRFEAAGRSCKARFVNDPSSTDGWAVAFRNRVPKGPDVNCK